VHHRGVGSNHAEAEQFIANPVLGELYCGVFDVSEVIHDLEDDSAIIGAGEDFDSAFADLCFHCTLLLERPLRWSGRGIDTVRVLVGHFRKALLGPTSKIATDPY
jgi:hypothetical protein